MTRPPRGQTVPTISGHAINEKGNGPVKKGQSNRLDSRVVPVPWVATGDAVTCAGVVPASVERVQKLSYPVMSTTRRALQRPAPELSCSVSGTADRPQFVIGIWPSVSPYSWGATQSHSSTNNGKGHSRNRSNGSINMDPVRVSIGPHNMAPDASRPRVPCSSATPAMKMKYDLVALR